MDLKKYYLDKLTSLIAQFDYERKERFYPFYLIVKGEKTHSRFKEALSIGSYFLDHAILNKPGDELFYKTLKALVNRYNPKNSNYWNYVEKTPVPMQDYLKVIYDL